MRLRDTQLAGRVRIGQVETSVVGGRWETEHISHISAGRFSEAKVPGIKGVGHPSRSPHFGFGDSCMCDGSSN